MEWYALKMDVQLNKYIYIKGGAHMHYVDLDAASLCVWAPPLMKVLRYSASNAVTWSKYAMK